MGEGYNEQDSGSSDPGMDEFLCEYVDGTMDPRVRLAFEEVLARDSVMAAHVQRLQETRALLCSYRCRLNAPGNFHHRLHREVTSEWMASMRPAESSAPHWLKSFAAVTSAAAALALVGMLVLGEGDGSAASIYHVTGETERMDGLPFGALLESGGVSLGQSVTAREFSLPLILDGQTGITPIHDIQMAGFPVRP